jgi:hypothetical protein
MKNDVYNFTVSPLYATIFFFLFHALGMVNE